MRSESLLRAHAKSAGSSCWGGHDNQPDAKFLTAELVEGAVEVQAFDVWARGGCAVLKFGGIACWKQEQHPRATRSLESIEGAAIARGAGKRRGGAGRAARPCFTRVRARRLPMPLDQPIGGISVSNSSVLPQAYALADDGRIARLELPYSAH